MIDITAGNSFFASSKFPLLTALRRDFSRFLILVRFTLLISRFFSSRRYFFIADL